MELIEFANLSNESKKVPPSIAILAGVNFPVIQGLKGLDSGGL